MNSPRRSSPWTRLVEAVRQRTDEDAPVPPHGFSTRVVALAFAQERRPAALLDRLALRALGVACVLALASVVVNYRAWEEREPVPDDASLVDPMSALLDL